MFCYIYKPSNEQIDIYLYDKILLANIFVTSNNDPPVAYPWSLTELGNICSSDLPINDDNFSFLVVYQQSLIEFLKMDGRMKKPVYRSYRGNMARCHFPGKFRCHYGYRDYSIFLPKIVSAGFSIHCCKYKPIWITNIYHPLPIFLPNLTFGLVPACCT